MSLGFDISNCQGKSDWSLVARAHMDFDIFKATEGLTFVDPYLDYNFKGSESIGLKDTVYHFGHPSNDPKKEAEHFYSTIKKYISSLELALFLDLEVTDGLEKQSNFKPEMIDNWAITFLDHLSYLSNHGVGIYSDSSFANVYLTNTLKKYKVHWIAQYSKTQPHMKFAIWQNSSTGHVDGISGNVDIDDGTANLLANSVAYDMFNVVVNKNVYAALVANNSTYVLWTALDEYNTPHIYHGNGKFTIMTKDIQGIVYKGDSYIPWENLAQGIQDIKVKWWFKVK